MNKKWMPITAGVLDIISGVLVISIGLSLLFFTLAVPWLSGLRRDFIIGGVLLVIIGVLAIVGGVYAFRRKRWQLALAGAIAALISSIPSMWFCWGSYDPFHISVWLYWGFGGIPAIVAIILTILSKKQFERK